MVDINNLAGWSGTYLHGFGVNLSGGVLKATWCVSDMLAYKSFVGLIF